MWIVGTIVLLAVGAALIVVVGWRPRAAPSPPLWDIPGSGATYTGIVGTLAGFTVASAIFIADLDGARTSPAFATVIGMLLVSFLMLVMTALMYASTPNAPAGDGDMVMQWLSHALANMSGCLSLTVSWLALAPVLELIGLPALADTFIWLLLIVALSASGSTALFAYRLTTASARACLAIPALGFGLAALYRLGAVRLWPALWPANDVALHFAVVAFAVVLLTFAFQSGLLFWHGDTMMHERVHYDGHRVILAYSQVAAVISGLMWFAVAMP